jgi:hypothetical protein
MAIGCFGHCDPPVLVFGRASHFPYAKGQLFDCRMQLIRKPVNNPKVADAAASLERCG